MTIPAIAYNRVITEMSQGYPIVAPLTRVRTPLERVAIAKNGMLALKEQGAVSALEALVGSKYFSSLELSNIVKIDHPGMSNRYISELCSETWSLEKDRYFPTLPADSQLLLVQYAMRTNNCIRGIRGMSVSVYSVLEMFETFSAHIQNNPLLQSITAVCNPALFKLLLSKQEMVLTPESVALGFLKCSSVTPDMYQRMDDDAFSSLIAYDPESPQFSFFNMTISSNHLLQAYPKDNIKLVLEHHPARYINSVLRLAEWRNAIKMNNTFFSSALDACIAKSMSEPSYVEEMGAWIFDRKLNKHIELLLQRYTPEAYSVLKICQSLTESKHSMETVKLWVSQLQQRTCNTVMGLPLNALELENIEHS